MIDDIVVVVDIVIQVVGRGDRTRSVVVVVRAVCWLCVGHVLVQSQAVRQLHPVVRRPATQRRAMHSAVCRVQNATSPTRTHRRHQHAHVRCSVDLCEKNVYKNPPVHWHCSMGDGKGIQAKHNLAPAIRNDFCLRDKILVEHVSHTRTVVRECCKGDEASQWENGKFDPLPRPNPLTDRHKKLHTWLRHGYLPTCKI